MRKKESFIFRAPHVNFHRKIKYTFVPYMDPCRSLGGQSDIKIIFFRYIIFYLLNRTFYFLFHI